MKPQYEAMLDLAATVGYAAGADTLPHDIETLRIPQNVAKLGKLASSLHKRYEAACSYQYANTDAYRTRTANLEKKAMEIAKELGVTLELQTDPRGWPFIVKLGAYETRLG